MLLTSPLNKKYMDEKELFRMTQAIYTHNNSIIQLFESKLSAFHSIFGSKWNPPAPEMKAHLWTETGPWNFSDWARLSVWNEESDSEPQMEDPLGSSGLIRFVLQRTAALSTSNIYGSHVRKTDIWDLWELTNMNSPGEHTHTHTHPFMVPILTSFAFNISIISYIDICSVFLFAIFSVVKLDLLLLLLLLVLFSEVVECLMHVSSM